MTQFALAPTLHDRTLDAAEAKAVYSRLRRGFQSGALRSESSRRRALKRLRAAIKSHEASLLDALHRDLGKPAMEAYTSEIGFCYQDIDHALDHLADWMRPREVGVPLALQPASAMSYVLPKGVVLIVSPWNYPLNLLFGPLIAAIAAGCHVVCKPAEDTPHTSLAMETVLREAFEPDQVAVVQGPGATIVPTLMDAVRFDHVFYTGSTRVGRILGERCGRELIPCTLELGGKSPAIVLEDARLKVAASRIAWGKCFNAGQTCVAPDYVLVHRSKCDAFVAEYARVLDKRYGRDVAASPDLGRIVSQAHTERLAGLLEGVEVAVGGEVDVADRFVAPTVVKLDSAKHPLMASEIFGPILPVIAFDTWEEAAAVVARYPNPLAAYLFTQSSASERRFLEELQFGGGCINDTIIHLGIPELPFGGVQQSGLGRYHARAGFEAFSNQRSIVRNVTVVDPPVRYAPYRDGVLRLVKWLLG